MNLNKYEIVYILRPDVTEATNLDLISYYKDLILSNGGINVVVKHRGRSHLSYNIGNYYDGIYVQVNYESNGKIVNIIEKSMRLNENILRYLTIRKS